MLFRPPATCLNCRAHVLPHTEGIEDGHAFLERLLPETASLSLYRELAGCSHLSILQETGLPIPRLSGRETSLEAAVSIPGHLGSASLPFSVHWPASSPLPGSDPSLEEVALSVDYPVLPVRSPQVLLLPPQGARCQGEPLPASSPLTASCQAPQEDRVWRAGLGGDPASSLPWGSSCLKCLIFLFNFLFSLLGVLALAFGLWGLAVKGSLRGTGEAALPEDPLLGLALGGLAVSAVSLAGSLGALCENACLLHCFSGGLIAFLALEAVVGSLLVALWGPLQDSLESMLRAAITHYQDDPDLRFLIDQVQLGLQCCGVSSYQDWTRNLSFNCSSTGAQACGLPASCCASPRGDGAADLDPCSFGALGPDEATQRLVHLEGCGLALRGWLRGNVRAAGACAIATVFVQGLELLLAARLARALAVRQGVAGSPRTAGTERPPAKLAQG